MSNRQVWALTLAAAVVTANAYYVHPIIARVAEDFQVSASMIGIVPAFNQIALALGIFLLLPLGDRYSNRTLSTVFVWGQFLSITLMAFSRDFALFVTGSTLLGFATIVPYLLPTYVSKRVDAQELGKVTAMLTTGIIAGILIARAGAGVVAEYFGWRTVYYIASSLMLIVAILLPLSMDRREPSSMTAKPTSYLTLIGSMLPLTGRYPEVLLSGSIQALSFGIFISIWMGLGLHLTSPEMGYGVDVVGYLAILAIVNVVTTPKFGALADRMGPRKTRLIASGFRLVGISLFLFFGHSLWLLIIPILIANIFGPVMDVTGRMTILKEKPEIRTRLMTVYIVFMFLGGGIASWAGTAVYDYWGWTGNATLAVSLSIIVSALSAWAYLRFER
ncbi:MAG: MFS transporter [Alphaproteobacteria bacterium]|nr:MFS transporter [Henriciella sp.]MBO6694166.1 MFS transporter [Henriciella sp.]MCH9750727.1 MFS transporter [Alphaproteobacteria bacterium]